MADNSFIVPSVVYGDPTGSPPLPYVEMGSVSQAYGPVDLHYAKAE
jgi:hypothetical protein